MPALDFDLLAALWRWLSSFPALFTDPKSVFWWPTLLVAGVVAVVFALLSGARPREIHRVLFPHDRRTLLRELPVDLACFAGYTAVPFLLGPVLFLIAFAGTSIGILILLPVFGLPAPEAPPPSTAWLALAAVVAFTLSDFSLYWTHRLFHRFPGLWRSHKLHHAPPVLTPLTGFRFWPHETFLHMAGAGFFQGLGLGLVAAVAGAQVSPMTVLGVNVLMLAWSLAFSHLRHSHVPIPYPRWLSFILISPHMHQVHHSSDPAHHDRNFGTTFAVWDWMFGTLYLPRRDERFHFGLEPPAEAAAPPR
ncbi:sterol desaturase family protein [Falsiroseomonas oryziterrae]|uniref:sterol desaturase family protein n=1 Tax=Falsiroseomonas oryziterrae TaxID=2911368 RepID=UPI001F17DE5F|nr:sterol desaturase family protein [Roseomonas sp. NPKOSM-4]